jgi:signal transduction histidine kinase
MELAPTTARTSADGEAAAQPAAARVGRARTEGPSTGRPEPPAPEIGVHHREANERLVAGVRLVAALVLLTALTTDTGPLHPALVKQLVAGYAAYAAAVLVASWYWPAPVTGHSGVFHAIDMAWTAVATTVSGGLHSHVFPFFTFVLATAAFRGGMWRTLLNAAIIVGVASAQSVLGAVGLVTWTFEWDVFVVQSSLIVGLALLLGVIFEREHVLRIQTLAMADLVSRVGRSPSLGPAVRDTLVRLVGLCGARRAQLVIEEIDSPTVSVWLAEAQPSGAVKVGVTSVPRDEAAAWLSAPSLNLSACELRRPEGARGTAAMSVGLDAQGTLCAGSFTLPPVMASAAWTVLLTVPINGNRFWGGQLYVLDPSRGPRGELRLRLLHRLVAQVSPALLTLYLLRRLRTRAESIERLRISKELHAGPLQTLAALEMRLEILRREADRVAPSLGAGVADVRDLLHDGAIEVRELMYRLRSSRVDARRLPYDLADMVERFGRTTGIDARFVWAADRLSLRPYQCAEVVRLLQEALVDARRHSGATSILVRVAADACAWELSIEDNGRGLGFVGRMTHEQLADHGHAPRSLRARVVALGGLLTASSSPAGTKLEMTFPLPGQLRPTAAGRSPDDRSGGGIK